MPDSPAELKRARLKRPEASWSRVVGRPRDDRIDADVVTAVLQTLRAQGYRAVTIEGIARKVGRARTSLYRRWRSKRDLVAYAVLREMGVQPAPDTGALRNDLEAAVRGLRRAFTGTLGQALAGLVADMAHDPALARTIRTEVLAARRSSLRAAFDRARARGEARGGLDVELLLDMLTGPFYYRVLFGHAPITRPMTAAVVEYVLQVAAPGKIRGTNRSRERS
ncbi:MAG TPA: TetR/AcrR family transcriptional regulator [Steroidobacteraceae bacterium]|nr:TetR/AcrR family transcriptional regulator [Steroidobacteraceae bacterium]